MLTQWYSHRALQRSYSSIVRYYTVGKSVKGLDIPALEISDLPGAGTEPDEVYVLYIGGQHGNEVR